MFKDISIENDVVRNIVYCINIMRKYEYEVCE